MHAAALCLQTAAASSTACPLECSNYVRAQRVRQCLIRDVLPPKRESSAHAAMRIRVFSGISGRR